MSVFGILFLVLIVVTIVIAISVLFGRGKKLKGVELPCCGSCHYCVRGLGTNTCPECGSNLNEVGVLTSVRSQARFSIHPALAWSIVYGFGLLFFGSFIVSVLPLQTISYGDQLITLENPKSGLYGSVILHQRIKQPAGTTIDQPITLELRDSYNIPISDITLIISLSDGFASIVQDGKVIQDNLDIENETIVEWLSKTGIYDDSALMDAEIATTLGKLSEKDWTQLLRPGWGGYSSSSSTTGTSRAFSKISLDSDFSSAQELVWYHQVMLLLAAIVWLGGIVLIFHTRGKRNLST